MPEQIEILVNGRTERIPDGLTLTRLLETKNLDRRYLVVEYNGEPLTASQLDDIDLRGGDRLELVRPVAGG
jgi:thiamine biosynthesis protein ThiS